VPLTTAPPWRGIGLPELSGASTRGGFRQRCRRPSRSTRPAPTTRPCGASVASRAGLVRGMPCGLGLHSRATQLAR
jgi:hypothetical protein